MHRSLLSSLITIIPLIAAAQQLPPRARTPSQDPNGPGVYPVDDESELVCTLQRRGASCGVEENHFLSTQLNKGSWWTCTKGNPKDCLAALVIDLQANLDACTCEQQDPALPASLKTLEALSRTDQIMQQGQKDQFTPGMELLANVLIQKARFCVFDVGAFSKLTQTTNSCSIGPA